jgi:hypothetical protein
MPQRFLRPTIRQSKRWNRCSYDAQSLFIRLLTLVDDFARYEADPELLRSEAFPYGDPAGNPITIDNICAQLQTLVSNDMITLYEVDGVKYLEVKRWKESARSKSSRFPPICKQMLTDVSKCSPPSSSSSSSSSPSPSPSPSSSERARACEAPGAEPEIPMTAANGDFSGISSLRETLNRVYSRPLTQPWTYAEESALAEIARRPSAVSEAEIICKFRRKLPDEDKRFFPQSAGKLLQKWDETLDRARAKSPLASQPEKLVKRPDNLKQFTPSPELAKKFRDAVNDQSNQA